MKRYLPAALFSAASIILAISIFVQSNHPAAAALTGTSGTFGKVVMQRGLLTATGVTGGTVGTTGLTTTKDSAILRFKNTSDAEMTVFSADSAVTLLVSAGETAYFDLRANDGIAFAPTTYKVYRSTAPTSGKVEIISIPVR